MRENRGEDDDGGKGEADIELDREGDREGEREVDKEEGVGWEKIRLMREGVRESLQSAKMRGENSLKNSLKEDLDGEGEAVDRGEFEFAEEDEKEWAEWVKLKSKNSINSLRLTEEEREGVGMVDGIFGLIREAKFDEELVETDEELNEELDRE
jgi:hypothetical protein